MNKPKAAQVIIQTDDVVVVLGRKGNIRLEAVDPPSPGQLAAVAYIKFILENGEESKAIRDLINPIFEKRAMQEEAASKLIVPGRTN